MDSSRAERDRGLAQELYDLGWRYAQNHPDELLVPEWVDSPEWCAGWADSRYMLERTANDNRKS